MNIPLDRLYHYIENIAEEIYDARVIIYRFYPHGSKNINDLINISEIKNEWYEKTISPSIWCNDQEPLDYEFYKVKVNLQQSEGTFLNILKSIGEFVLPKNLNYQKNIFEKGLLLHSEQRSSEVEKYRLNNELIPVYYWSHAIIARDWFRYAEHISRTKNVKKTFLIYNRAWSGTREYRLTFAELLVRLGLQDSCQTSISPVEPELGIHYDLHRFKNPGWRPNIVLENFFPINTAKSHYSADFDIEDYKATDIEIVLETLFEDSRLHLTEKSLRPIALGQPFILAGTHLSLEYLRSYGFRTFGHIWDERYDQCIDPQERLIRIADLMKHIANWSPSVREIKMAKAQAVADYNKKHFFSQKFFNLIVNELKTNLTSAFDELQQCDNYSVWVSRWNTLLTYPEIISFLNGNQNHKEPTMLQVKRVLELASSANTI
jgi:hypothetical protein